MANQIYRLSTEGHIESDGEELAGASSNIEEVLSDETICNAVGQLPPLVDHGGEHSHDQSTESLSRIGVEELLDREVNLIQVAISVSSGGVVSELLVGLVEFDHIVGHPNESVVNQINRAVSSSGKSVTTDLTAVFILGSVDKT